MVVAGMLAASLTLAPGSASAEGLFDAFFGGIQKMQARQAPAQANFFADPFGLNQQHNSRRRRRRAWPAPDLPFACAVATANISR